MYLLCVSTSFVLFCNDTATTEIYTYGHTRSRPDALPICTVDDVAGAAEADHRHPGSERRAGAGRRILDREAGGRIDAQSLGGGEIDVGVRLAAFPRSEEHTSELQSLMSISYAVFCLKKNKTRNIHIRTEHDHN